MQYFVIMTDLGRLGLEAIVHPEDTRRSVIERVREYLGDGKGIAFIHEVNDFGDGHMIVSDVKDEIIAEARNEVMEAV